jgi:hypothetical protein
MAYRLNVKHRGKVGLRVIHDRFGNAHQLTPGAEVKGIEVSNPEAKLFVLRSDKFDDLEVTSEPEFFDESKVQKKEETEGLDLKRGMFMTDADRAQRARMDEQEKLEAAERKLREEQAKAAADAAAATRPTSANAAATTADGSPTGRSDNAAIDQQVKSGEKNK